MKRKKERAIKWLFTVTAFASLAFLGGHGWYPTAEPPEFGILMN